MVCAIDFLNIEPSKYISVVCTFPLLDLVYKIVCLQTFSYNSGSSKLPFHASQPISE